MGFILVIFRLLVALGSVVLIVGGVIAGVHAAGQREEVIGGILGGVGGTISAALVFGVLIILLEIHKNTAEMNTRQKIFVGRVTSTLDRIAAETGREKPG